MTRAGWALVVGGAAVVAAVLLLPRKPGSSVEAEVPAADSLPADPVDRAVALVNGENPMAGIQALRDLAAADPPNVDAVVWLGIFSIQSGQKDKAREHFARVLTLEPAHTEATWQLALLDMEEGRYDAAVVGFEACMAADSSYANGLFFTARCYEAMGNTQGALNRFREYLPYAPDTAVAAKVREMIAELEAGGAGKTE